ncbi:hypothetical protein EVAR_23887_1 [Eumeta japonica]|uniref:Uncharacterized protein n=1 Tax=Eumeta variegata TaxID=151549 RepID=A0A4C1V635_EUMVA|nr:hypothetical protein EVAR_23887_1 [Eumeta japonica]
MLKNTQIPPALVRTVASFLEGRNFFVAVDATSDSRPIRRATRQLSIARISNVIPSSRSRGSEAAEGSRPTTRLAGQMSSRRQCDEDGRLIDRSTAYYATEAEPPRTGSEMTDQGVIFVRTDRSRWSLKWSMSSTKADPRGACCAQYSDCTYRSEPCTRATSVLGSLTQQQHEAGRYVLNDVIARYLRTETVEEFITHLAHRLHDFADQGLHEFVRNIAPMHERLPSGQLLPRQLIKSPPPT